MFFLSYLSHIRIVYADLDSNDKIDSPSEILQENHFYPYGMQMKGNWMQNLAQPVAYDFNGIEKVDDFGLGVNMAFYRTLDTALGQWWQVDPAAEAFGSMSPYCAMGASPFVYNDPQGDEIITAILIGMAIGAATHTATHYVSNDFSFNNWNWGAFAGSTIAGGVGGGVSSSLATAQIGGFYGGSITGAASGFTQSFISGLANQNLSIGRLAKGTFIGAGIGGAIGGIDASLKGNNFWDGRSKLPSERFITDERDLIYKDDEYYAYEKNSYNNKTRSYSGNEGIPSSRGIEINKGFEGNLTAELDVLPQNGETYFFKIDDEIVFQTSVRYRGRLVIPKNSKIVEFGIKGATTRIGTNVGGTVASVGAHPSSWTKIYGSWKSTLTPKHWTAN